MKYVCAILLIGCCLAGCRRGEETTPVVTEQNAAGNQTPPGGISPMTTTPIPNAPVAGAESLQGGGSGVGNVMKDRARDIARGGGAAGMNQPPPDDGG